MSVQTYHLEMRWPIEDPDERLEWLKSQAAGDLEEALYRHSLTRTGRIAWAVTHGHQATLTAVLSVTGPAGLPRTITTHDHADRADETKEAA